jgi:hypothetical protein
LLRRAIAAGLLCLAVATGAAAAAGDAAVADGLPTGAPAAGPGSPEGGSRPLSDPGWPEAVSDPVRSALLRAWSAPAADLDERVRRTQQAGLALGMRDLEAPAHALLLDDAAGTPLERAQAAVRLAPGLPAARFALARILLEEEHALHAAAIEAAAGVRVLGRHFEAWRWLRANALLALGRTCAVAGIAFLLLAGTASLPGALAALGARVAAWPESSRLATVGAVLLLPAAAGEGLFGVALGFGAAALAWGTLASRAAVAAAAALVFAGLFPLADRAGGAVAALRGGSVAEAVFATEHGLPTPAELTRLERAEGALAAAALAARERREGRLEAALARYQALLPDADARIAHNAANVELVLGRYDAAIALHESASRELRSPVALFNLSQAYGRDVDLERQDLALAEAQAVGAPAVADLTELLGGAQGAVAVDLPPDSASLLGAAEDPDAAAHLAAAQRRRFAPGALGRTPGAALAGLAACAALGLVAGAASRRASRAGGGDFYAGVARVLQGGGGDARGRAHRLAELRARRERWARVRLALSFVVPGAAGVLGGRPLLGLVALVATSGAAALWQVREGVVPDPLAAGEAAALAVAAGVGALGAAAVLATALALRWREGG